VAICAWSAARDVPEPVTWIYREGCSFLHKNDAREAEKQAVASLLREVVSNPFRTITPDTTWLTSTVTHLANTIYTDRAFGRLPILADALEGAGCTNQEVLSHCRGPGPHARGCWALDLVLGKE